MTAGASANTSSHFTVKEIIERYESEEDEFLREIEEMRSALQPSDPEEDLGGEQTQPILSVFCNMMDEIGSLRTENNRLKNRLSINASPRSKNLVQRLSAVLDSSRVLPLLRRSTNQEVRVGARERLSTPPPKDLTTSSISTDFSHDSTRDRRPPLVEPENSESEGSVDDYDERSRRRTRDVRDASLSQCTSPSSASSSRDPSEALTTSRSSFLSLLGFPKRVDPPTSSSPSLLIPPKRHLLKRRKRRSSENNLLPVVNCTTSRARPHAKPPRPATYYPRETSEDSDVNNSKKRISHSSTNIKEVQSQETLNLMAQHNSILRNMRTMDATIEELQIRNQRLVDQLREKSQVISRMQLKIHRLEQQINDNENRAIMLDAFDRLTTEEKLHRDTYRLFEKVEKRLRHMEDVMKNAKIDAVNSHQMVLNASVNERSLYQACLQQLENVQRENITLRQSRCFDFEGNDEETVIANTCDTPSYDALYKFSSGVVRKLNECRWSYLLKNSECSRFDLQLIETQSSLILAQLQTERYKFKLNEDKDRKRRSSSYHGEDLKEREIKRRLNFFVPLKLQAARASQKRTSRANEATSCDVFNDGNIDEEFLRFFERNRNLTSFNRIEHMIKEMGRQRPKIDRAASVRVADMRRPISLVEVEDQRSKRRFDETRRSIRQLRNFRQASIDECARNYESVAMSTATPPTPIRSSVQDITSNTRSPTTTPVAARRRMQERRFPIYDKPEPVVPPPRPERGRFERMDSFDRGNAVTHDERKETQTVRKEENSNRIADDGFRKEIVAEQPIVTFRNRKEVARTSMAEERREQENQKQERRLSRIQRSQPVQATAVNATARPRIPVRMRTIDRQTTICSPSSKLQQPRLSTLPIEKNTQIRPPEVVQLREPPPSASGGSRLPVRKSWLDRFKNLKI